MSAGDLDNLILDRFYIMFTIIIFSAQENWLRVEMVPGDMIILPSGIYHRFTLDMKVGFLEIYPASNYLKHDFIIQNYIRAKRFFVGEPVWIAHNRPNDDMECRKDYVKKLEDNEF